MDTSSPNTFELRTLSSHSKVKFHLCSWYLSLDSYTHSLPEVYLCKLDPEVLSSAYILLSVIIICVRLVKLWSLFCSIPSFFLQERHEAGFVSCSKGCESVLWLQKAPKICEYMYLRKEGHSHGWKNYPWGCTCLLCGSSILSNTPDFACCKIHALRAPTPLLLLNIHQVRKKMGKKIWSAPMTFNFPVCSRSLRWFPCLWAVASLIFQGKRTRKTLQGTCKCPYCLASPSPGLGARPLSTASGMMPTVQRKSLFVSTVGPEFH